MKVLNGCLLFTLIPLCACAMPEAPAAPTTRSPIMQDQMSAVPGTPWPATDNLDRALPLSDEVGPPKQGRFVGIFYFLWMGQHDRVTDRIYDVAEILRKDPDALSKPDSPLWGPEGQMHFWGEPLFGYYRSEDRWVLRRHAQLLSDAGIDTLIFDTTNRTTYRENYMTLLDVFSEVRKEGFPTPQVTFMTNTEAGATAQELYEDLYKPGRHEDLWFRWQGKPLLICDPAAASEEVKAFFTLRKAHWPFEQVNTQNAWHWEATYPQHYGYVDDPNQPEQVNVSVAQNLRIEDGAVTNMSDGNARGRSFHDGARDTSPGAVNQGLNFQEQWERAIELDPPFVMVTGWNEWLAGKWSRPGNPIVFVDQYDQEHSRDIEMVKGLHGDNYYYQLVANVRRYKGALPVPPAGEAKTIDVAGGFVQWDAVAPAFRDHQRENEARNEPGVATKHYITKQGNNDFVLAKASRDASHVFFMAQTREVITGFGASNWMMLLIDSDANPDTGWEGYDFVVNRMGSKQDEAIVERNMGGWKWEEVARVPMKVWLDKLHLAIPRHVLGIPESEGFTIDFKWTDSLEKVGDVMAFYLGGDTAPQGRFNYRYVAR